MARDLDGVAEAYRAPEADDDLARPNADGSAGFYVVSTRKMVVLYVATLGTYGAYWFYKQWRAQTRHHGLNAWPFARAVFAVFFVHQLFRRIAAAADDARYSPAWNPGAQATLYVALAIATRFMGRVAPGPLGAAVTLAVTFMTAVPLVSAQGVVNLASGDETGSANARFDGGSLVVLGLCALLWLGIVAAVLSGTVEFLS